MCTLSIGNMSPLISLLAAHIALTAGFANSSERAAAQGPQWLQFSGEAE